MAAPTVIGTSSAARSGGPGLTFAHTAAGDLLFVSMAFVSSATVLSITYGGVALTRLGRAVIATYDHEWWYLPAPTPGVANVVITTTGPVFEICGLARNVAGLSLGGTLVSTSVGASAALSLAVPSANGALVLDFLSSPTPSVVFTVGAGQTLNVTQDGLAGSSLRCAGSSEPGAPSVAMSWTFAPNATVNSSALSVTTVVVPGAPVKAKLGNKHGKTNEHGAVVVVPATTPGTPGVIGPLTVFPHLCGETTDTGLQVTSVTVGALRTPRTPLGNLRVTTDDQGSLRVAPVTAGVLGPLTDLGNLLCRTDETGALIVTSGAAGSLTSAPSPLLNLRGRTDDQGALVVTGLSNPLAYQQRIIADGALAYWPLDDGPGTVARDAAGSRTGTIVGTVPRVAGVTAAQGAMTFDGANPGAGVTRVTLPTIPSISATGHTVEAWAFYPDGSPTGVGMILTRLGFSAGCFAFGLIGTGPALSFIRMGYSGVVNLNSDTMVPSASWHHLVVTNDASTARFYLDGVLHNTPAVTFTDVSTAATLCIGGSPDQGSSTIVMQDIAIYLRPLTGAEILAHYNLRLAT